MSQKKNRFAKIALFMAILFFLPKVVSAADSRSPDVRIFNSSDTVLTEEFSAYSPDFTGGVSVAACDLDGNGTSEFVTAPGTGGGPQIRTFDTSGSPVFTPGFFAYAENFRGGVNVACEDLDGDGKAEIVTAPKSNGGPQVRIFDRYGHSIFTPGFFAYDEKFRGGVNLAIGDIDGGGLKEIITAPALGSEGKVKIFNRFGALLNFDIQPFHPDFTGGISITTANVDGGAEEELIMAVQSQDVSLVKVIKPNINQQLIGEFIAFPNSFKGGINVSGGDVDRDGYDEIIVAANSGGGPHVKAFEAYGQPIQTNLFAYEDDFRGGVNLAMADINADGTEEIITAPNKKNSDLKVTSILVDLSEQRLYAYNENTLIKTFLVSTGVPGMDTHTGQFSVSQKTYSKLYAGPGFFLPNTLWNMRFDGPRWLHGAYWHNNFGHKMSHGCVNIDYKNAKWLYNLTAVGTRVTVRQ
jgi:hypothetical protein